MRCREQADLNSFTYRLMYHCLSAFTCGTMLRFLNTDSVATWYPPEDQHNRHAHHDDQCNYPFHFCPPLCRHVI